MRVLIVQSKTELGELWKRHIEGIGAEVVLTVGQTDAARVLLSSEVHVILLDLVLEEGSALAVADLAAYRWPDARVIFVTSTRIFSDGSIFEICSNACAHVQSSTPPEDLAAMVEHFGRPAAR